MKRYAINAEVITTMDGGTLGNTPADGESEAEIPVVDLSLAHGERATWDRPRWLIYLWALTELLFVTNPFQISSKLRVRILRIFGAEIGDGVIFRPRTRVRFPWKLSIGDRSWIGEGVWIHNQDIVRLGHDCVISQETFITTGSHALRHDMALITQPVNIGDGAWITARCIVLGGSNVGSSAVIPPGTVVRHDVPDNVVLALPPLPSAGATRFNVEAPRPEKKRV